MLHYLQYFRNTLPVKKIRGDFILKWNSDIQYNNCFTFFGIVGQ